MGRCPGVGNQENSGACLEWVSERRRWATGSGAAEKGSGSREGLWGRWWAVSLCRPQGFLPGRLPPSRAAAITICAHMGLLPACSLPALLGEILQRRRFSKCSWASAGFQGRGSGAAKQTLLPALPSVNSCSAPAQPDLQPPPPAGEALMPGFPECGFSSLFPGARAGALGFRLPRLVGTGLAWRRPQVGAGPPGYR